MDKKFELLNDSGQTTGVDVVVIGDCVSFEECGSSIMDIYKDEVDGLISVLQEIKKHYEGEDNA